MKERALALGGTLEIESAPAQGTEIRACFPTESKGEELTGSNATILAAIQPPQSNATRPWL